VIIGTASKNRPLFLAVNNNPVERITCLTLPGINISNNLRWDVHVDVLCVKVESRLYFLYCLNVMDCQLMIFLMALYEFCIIITHSHSSARLF